MKIVEPYIIIMSPLCRTPTLTASAAASMVPVVTGVPGARPVSCAACAVMWPAISVDQSSFGSLSSAMMSGARSLVQSRVSTS